MHFGLLVVIIASFSTNNVSGKKLDISIDTVSWSDYITGYKGIGIDSLSFRNFKENLVFVLEHNQRNHQNKLGLSPMMHLSKEQFELNFQENHDVIYPSFIYDSSIFSPLFGGMTNGKYYNWKDKNMIVVSDSYHGKPNSWIYTAKSVIESMYLIRYDLSVDLDIVNIRECSKNKKSAMVATVSDFLEYSSENPILLSSHRKSGSDCISVDITATAATIDQIDPIMTVTAESIHYGPLIVEMDLNFDSIKYYENGKVISPDSQNDSPNYSGLIVGYGREDDINYFIVQTFFGNNWGNEGTFKLNVNSNVIKYVYSL